MLYNFERLIEKYSRYSGEFEKIESADGQYVNGHYVEGDAVRTVCSGVITPYVGTGRSNSAMSEGSQYGMGGSYSTKDKQLFMKTPLTDKDLKKVHVIYRGDKYSVEMFSGYGQFANVYMYGLKWVSGFEESET